ncbi:hypothetical protein Hypma_011744 [Hypsizygus marmoreus]|uniref:Mid2 domain-containing protein n=1 Tax=Hypsizygus marmoreus TaxID=39966 RepID=A0A369JR17_HYPMA|nr:hypothetical protein Hypma_011744 [Hypsizygus marmoreus]
MPPRLLLFLPLNSLLLIVSLGTNGALGATCTLPSFQWATNSQRQDPCSLAVQLGGVCGIQSVLPDLEGADDHYDPPTTDSQNSCTCSSVIYLLVSACAECQGASSSSWSRWIVNCSEPSSGFPQTLPAGVAVPSWAYLDVAVSDKFDAEQAQRTATRRPTESTGPGITLTDTDTALPTSPISLPPKPSSTSSTAPIAIASTTSLALPATQVPSTTSSKSNSNIGPIVGGAIGGFVFVVLTAGLLFWWIIRRRRSRIAPSTAYKNAYGALTHGSQPDAFYSRVRSPPVSTSPPPESPTTFESSKEGRFSPMAI